MASLSHSLERKGGSLSGFFLCVIKPSFFSTIASTSISLASKSSMGGWQKIEDGGEIRGSAGRSFGPTNF